MEIKPEHHDLNTYTENENLHPFLSGEKEFATEFPNDHNLRIEFVGAALKAHSGGYLDNDKLLITWQLTFDDICNAIQIYQTWEFSREDNIRKELLRKSLAIYLESQVWKVSNEYSNIIADIILTASFNRDVINFGMIRNLLANYVPLLTALMPIYQNYPALPLSDVLVNNDRCLDECDLLSKAFDRCRSPFANILSHLALRDEQKQRFVNWIIKNSEFLPANILDSLNESQVNTLAKACGFFELTERLDVNSPLFKLDNNTTSVMGNTRLYKFAGEGLNDIEYLNSLKENSLEHLVYSRYTNVRLPIDNLRPIDDVYNFCKSDAMNFLVNEIFSKLANKALELTKYDNKKNKNRINTIYRTVTNELNKLCYETIPGLIYDLQEGQEIKAVVYNNLSTKLKSLANNPEIKELDNKLGVFFLNLLGALLSAPFLFLPCFTEGYKNIFFKDLFWQNSSESKFLEELESTFTSNFPQT